MENQLHDIFIQEAEDNLTLLEGAIINIEENPEDDKTINEAFRSIHSIKGGAGLAGFSGIKDFTHIVEDLFEYIRNGSIKTEAKHISVILKSLDIIKFMVQNIKNNRDSNDGVETESVLNEIKSFIKDTEEGSTTPATPPEETAKDNINQNYFFISLSYYPEIFTTGIDPIMFISDLQKAGEILYIHTENSAFPEIEDFNPEHFYLSWKLFFATNKNEHDLLDIFCFVIDESDIVIKNMSEESEAVRSLPEYMIQEKSIQDFLPVKRADINDEPIVEENPSEKMEEAKEENTPAPQMNRRSTDLIRGDRQDSALGSASFIRVPTDKLENIFNTVSELLISQARLNMLTEEHEDDIPDSFFTVTDSLKNITGILQEQVTSLRMMSLGSTFDRFKRVVRDIATERNKKVKLTLSGQETELDKNMIEKLNDPLKHLVRNCIDHGIETEAERIKKGKSPEGHLGLSAYIENGKVIIEVSDDGSGIDREKLLRKAIEKGLIQDDHKLSDGEIMNLIFHPGLSTAEKVTDLSGRGVGMDVVKSSIIDLHGNIEISSEKDKGTIFRLHLPLTLAILDGMLVHVGKEKYILPTLSILEIFQPLNDHVKTISGKGEVVFFRGDYIPLIRLHGHLGIKESITEPTKAELIVIYSGGVKAAILVDTVVDQFQIVLKSLQKNFRKVENISSATILGNGDVALIIDIQNLLQSRTVSSDV
ncbi:MAG: chemotaxis protein CheA [Spirochaetales bacterium]|nr:chemotaxis protein CheA [Spirochaetales bacterium]